MRFTDKELEQWLTEQIRSSETAGLRDRWYDTISIAYYAGNQWARQSSANASSSRNSMNSRWLKVVLDPTRPDIRVTMNLIEENVTKVDSKLTPQEIPFGVVPQASTNPADRVVADIAETLARSDTEAKAFLPHLQYASWKRVVLGTGILKQVLIDPGNRRDYFFADVDKWSIVLDPANFHPDIARCHRWLIHSYAVPNEELKKRYGMADIQPQAKLGELYLESSLFNSVGGSRYSARAHSSTAEANMVHELYYGSEPGQYDELYIVCRTKDSKARVLWAGPNPFPSLPFMKLDYRPRIDSPWGKGVPLINLNAQDIYNLAMTNLMRYLVHASWVKWIAPKETLDSDTRSALTNNLMCSLIEYTPSITGDHKPEPARLPELPSVAPGFVEMMPEIGQRQVGLSLVNYGITSKRGEPAGTVKQKIDEAGSINTRISSGDANEIRRFLNNVAMFPVVHRDFETLTEKVGDKFTPDQLELYMQTDPKRPNLRYHVVPGALLPKTALEHKQELLMELGSGALTPMEYRMTMFARTGVASSRLDDVTFRLAEEENRMMLAGKEPPVMPNDFHEGHEQVHLICYNDPVTRFRYGPDAIDRINQHVQDHRDAREVQALATVDVSAPGQGTGYGPMPPEIMQGAAGEALGGRSPNPRNMLRSMGASAEQMVA